jgi:hypothetical protein
VRVGDSPSSLEASFTLRQPVPAGTWGLIGDGIVLGSGVTNVTVLFEVRWRRAGAADDRGDVVLVSVTHTFVRDPNPDRAFRAVPFETTAPGLAAPAAPGDLLVLRFTALRGDSGAVFVPNGDGVTTFGRIPRLNLPQASP